MTTALFLQLKGYETRVCSERIPYDDERVPSVATNYAAASVKPVHVDEDDIGELTRVSEGFFEKIEARTDCVRRQRAFELYENNTLKDGSLGYTPVEDYDGPVPERDGADEATGYVYELFFVEMPEYVPALVRWYRESGGTIEKKRVEKDSIGSLGGEVVVNCTGYPNMFGDESLVAKKGHLVYVDTGGRIKDEDGDDFCYTYHLDDGFVYAYPRDDSLVLGGSAYEGRVVDGEWVGETADETVRVGDTEVPRRILNVNRDLIRSIAGVDISGHEKEGSFGYRPYRHGGVRTEKQECDGKEVVHCYGHGGAGVTLSWLSANRVYNLITGETGYDYGTVDQIARLLDSETE